jgi:hypothetical protein
MARFTGNWRELTHAAARKIAIAEYHQQRLVIELEAAARSSIDSIPPIPVQAHFEGVVIAVMAAVDQTAAAVNQALNLRLPQRELVKGAFGELGQRLPAIRSWYSEDIYADVRELRVRVIHYSYAKNPGAPRWVVESVGSPYQYSRDLLDYATAASQHGRRLGELLDNVEAELARGQTSLSKRQQAAEPLYGLNRMNKGSDSGRVAGGDVAS